LTDGDEFVSGSLVGPQGNPGITGVEGPQGQQGNPGANGINGINGTNGTNGEDGNSCSVLVSLDGTKTISCTDGTSATVFDGTPGLPGADGSSCSVADNGDGTKTISCTDGTFVTVSDGAQGMPGSPGANGTNGTAGTSGLPGAPGADGSSCSVADNGNGTKTISCTDGTSAILSDGANGANIFSTGVLGGGDKIFGTWAFSECPAGTFPLSGYGMCQGSSAAINITCPAIWTQFTPDLGVFNCAQSQNATGWGVKCTQEANAIATAFCLPKP
jgi:hypothetical protein